ncbi:hypothetical protein ACHAPY_009444 [Fusarium culmorum]
MANYTSTGTAYSGSVHKFLNKINRLSEIVWHMSYDFPVLDRAQREMGLVIFPFNLPSRDFMQALDEDLSEVSSEMEIFISHLSDEENPGLRDYLVQKLELVESAFDRIHMVVLKLDPVRLDETLNELGEADDCLSTSLESLLRSEDRVYYLWWVM